MLHFETLGVGPSVTFVHGFTQTGKSWLPVINRLCDTYTCTTVDAPGHGESPDGTMSLKSAGDAIAATMQPGTLVGYSMGARMALHAALQHPDIVTRLVLVSGTAGIDDPEERSARIVSDEKLADHIEEVGVEVFLHEWLSNPLFAGLSEEKAQLLDRQRNSAQGLANSLRFSGTGTQTPLWDQLAKLDIPVLLVAGNLDPKFVALAERMHSLVRSSTLKIVEGSGHTVHLEQTDMFCDILHSWLRATDSRQ